MSRLLTKKKKKTLHGTKLDPAIYPDVAVYQSVTQGNYGGTL